MKEDVYRVVGICADGSRMVIHGRLALWETEEIKQSLMGGNAFRRIDVEADDQPAPPLSVRPPLDKKLLPSALPRRVTGE
jgi:hypothetical protein